ncbi:dienelactone hydrolase family protein [Minwuia thermotolerans]|uniref:Carboxymethylenebutenolidase n=1 Tax=Minwuia thermotolerans TaxID=2056226 RepID=A0A2M9G4A9_9PROT|nr:dienelactone hydrolase family protein [Minwuia thermotolerans]PJK30555.1 carboxymethylenebutenolidase [Minwuia thermotolerans]
MGEDIRIKAKDGGGFGGYLAKPASGSGPGVVVIQEIFGVNQVMRGITDWLASEGFVALCPDLFWRIEPGIQITDKTEQEWAKAFELFQKFDVDKGMEDIQATIDHLRGVDGCTGKVGTVGFCLGGLLTYLSMTRTDADAGSGYYGVNIDKMLGEAKNISRPLILHVATEDGFVDKEAQAKMHEGLDSHEHVTLYDYEGNDHAFARVGGEHYDEKAAQLANQRTLELFRSALA